MMNSLRFQGRHFVIADGTMQETLDLATRAAKSQVSVLLVGESGTGKELIARYIHERSSLASGPFVAVNCAALPEGLIESELFGYEKGAFTGATERRLGKFERAQGGTLLLDEISEMPVFLQAKLLRVLQELEVERLGGHKPIKLSVRVIATTNRSPEKLITLGQFREDLYFRLSVMTILCPPLRGRFSAIRNLAEAFIDEWKERENRRSLKVSHGVFRHLQTHVWHGNIRELHNCLQRGLLVCDGDELLPEHLTFTLRENDSAERPQSLNDIEKQHILRVLQEADENREETARRLGITSRTLRSKLRLYNV